MVVKQFLSLPIDKVHPYPGNPRKNKPFSFDFGFDDIGELADEQNIRR
jgi:hypothetical protein